MDSGIRGYSGDTEGVILEKDTEVATENTLDKIHADTEDILHTNNLQTGGKRRKSRRKTRRKSRRKSRRKTRRKSRRKSRRKTRRKTRKQKGGNTQEVEYTGDNAEVIKAAYEAAHSSQGPHINAMYKGGCRKKSRKNRKSRRNKK